MALLQLSLLAPSPYAVYSTRDGVITADANCMISGVPAGSHGVADLLDSGCIPVSANPYANFRNALVGGDFTVNPFQRDCVGLATAHVNTTDIANTLTYFPDCWFAIGGASSAIKMGPVADTTVPGFSQCCIHQRTAGNADTAALNFGQVVDQLEVVKFQGQTATFSFWARKAADYSGGDLTVKLITGTGDSSNCTAANMVAGSWTGQANAISATQTLSGLMTRYSFSATIPISATELGVLLTWTPSGTAGTTDGIYFGGLQLEAGLLSPFEHRDVQQELKMCQRRAFLIPEPAAGTPIGYGNMGTTTTARVVIPTPVKMRGKPTLSIAAGGFKVSPAGVAASGTMSTTSALQTPNSVNVNFTSVTASTAGFAVQALGTSVASGGYILASCDY